MTECIVCLDNEAIYRYTRCEHNTLCKKCIHKLEKTNALPLLCMYCQTPSHYISTNNKKTNKSKTVYVLNKDKFERAPVVPIKKQNVSEQIVIDEINKYYGLYPNNRVKLLITLLKQAQDIDKWVEIYKEGLNQYYKYQMTHYICCMFTVDQTNAIAATKAHMILPHKYYYINNDLVRFCIYPWKLDTKIYSHGLCYHGNFEEVPKTIETALNMLEYNREKQL